MDISKAKSTIEAILFASGEPYEISKLAGVIEIDEKTVINLVKEINDEYIEQNRGFRIKKLDYCFQMVSASEFSEYIRKALDHRKNTPLSNAALEILAVIAYNQPVTKSYVEQIRGVDCFYGINSLVEKGLICEAGRLDAPGRPRLYRTTKDFLRCFEIENLDMLPNLPELNKEDNEQQEIGEII